MLSLNMSFENNGTSAVVSYCCRWFGLKTTSTRENGERKAVQEYMEQIAVLFRCCETVSVLKGCSCTCSEAAVHLEGKWEGNELSKRIIKNASRKKKRPSSGNQIDMLCIIPSPCSHAWLELILWMKMVHVSKRLGCWHNVIPFTCDFMDQHDNAFWTFIKCLFELQVGSKWLVAMGLLGGVSFKVRHL